MKITELMKSMIDDFGPHMSGSDSGEQVVEIFSRNGLSEELPEDDQRNAAAADVSRTTGNS